MPPNKLKKIAFFLMACGPVAAISGIVGAYFYTYPGIQVDRVSFPTKYYESPAQRVRLF